MVSNEVPYLVLVRHGQSEWNQKNLFTGWKNPPLTKQGEEEAIRAAEKISRLGIHFDMHFTSKLIRAQKTGELILKELDQVGLKILFWKIRPCKSLYFVHSENYLNSTLLVYKSFSFLCQKMF